MIRHLLSLAVLLVLTACSSARPASEGASTLAIRDVSVIDGTGAPARSGMTVLIAGDRIGGIGKAGEVEVPRDAEVVDGSGRFLIPGLWDMHTHFVHEEVMLPLYLANGVTGLRDMGGEMETLRLRDEIRRGERLGPRIYTTGFMIDGVKPDAEHRIGVETPEQARAAVDRLADAGVDFVKVHNGLPREAYFAVADETRKRGLRFAGHIPRGITLEEALEAKQHSIEHVSALLETLLPPETMKSLPAFESSLQDLLERRAGELFPAIARNGTWYAPTLIAMVAAAQRVDPATRDGDERLRYLAPSLRAYWDKYFPHETDRPREVVEGRRLLAEKGKDIVAAMHRAGVPLLAGTDVGLRYIFPGFSLHDELELLVASGLTPMEALQTATANPARFLGQEDLGTIETGKSADLVLLDADPLANIRSTRRIQAVVANGRLLRRADLDRMLAEVEKKVKAGALPP